MNSKIEALQAEYLEAGGNPLLKSFQKEIEKAENRAAKKVEAQVENQPKWAKRLLTFVNAGVSLISVAFVFILIFGGLTIGTGLLVMAEIEAVRVGFNVIDPANAFLYSVALVSFFFVMLFIRETLPHSDESKRRFSFRNWASDFAYIFGITRWWQEEKAVQTSLHGRITGVIRLTTVTIILFGVLGRLDVLLIETDGQAWWVGLEVLAQSSLRDVLGLIGAPLTALALLGASHFVVSYVYSNFSRLVGAGNFTLGSSSVTYEEALAEELETLYQFAIKRQKEKNQQESVNQESES